MRSDRDRKRWVDKDEGLKSAWKESGLSKRQWIQENRRLIDDVAGNETDEPAPVHKKEYPGARRHGKW